MKDLFILFSMLSLVSFPLLGQYELEGNFDMIFDNDYGLAHLTIDTVSNPSNIWQIGTPQKDGFINGNSHPLVIVTDTINPYPVNDTSTFTITNVALGYGFDWPHTVILSGWYNVYSDSLKDYGKIEFSPDNGHTWVDMLQDTVPGIGWYSDWYWDGYRKPVLTGNSNGWKSFKINLAELGKILNVTYGDTVIYRFSFISDNVQTNKPGIMFDDFHFEDWVESGIDEPDNNDVKSFCYPNPVKNTLNLVLFYQEDIHYKIEIYDCTGRKAIYLPNIHTQNISINTTDLTPGLFYYRITDIKSKKLSEGRFIKN